MRLIGAFLKFCAVGALLGLTLGVAQRFHPAFDSFSHFRLHFAILAAVGLGLLALLHYRGGARVLALAFAAISGFWVWGQQPRPLYSLSPYADFTIAQYNLYFHNRQSAQYVSGLRAIDADVVLLQEDMPYHRAALKDGLSDLYPYQHWCKSEDSPRIGGVGILSKTPLTDGGCTSNSNLMWRRLEEFGISVASIHLHWPWPFSQHQQIDRFAPLVSEIPGPLVLGGDFNAAPWSDAVRRFRKAGGLSRLPGAPMTIRKKGIPIPIDHQLHSAQLCPTERRLWPSSFGSDHFPVVVGYKFCAKLDGESIDGQRSISAKGLAAKERRRLCLRPQAPEWHATLRHYSHRLCIRAGLDRQPIDAGRHAALRAVS